MVNIFAGGDQPVTQTVGTLAEYDLLVPPAWFDILNPADRKSAILVVEIDNGQPGSILEVQGRHSPTGSEFNVAEITVSLASGDYGDLAFLSLPRFVRCGFSSHSGTTTKVFVAIDAAVRQEI